MTESDMLVIAGLAGLFCIANGASALAFKLDKDRARAGEWRISEATLLTLALLGGWFGAKWAQHRFRHKTRKEPFRTTLNLIGFIHLALAGLMLTPAADRYIREFANIAAASVSTVTAGAERTPARRTLPRRFGPGSEAGMERAFGRD